VDKGLIVGKVVEDALVSAQVAGELEEALAEAIESSFNMVSVDGDMSTNDSCFILANGMAGRAGTPLQPKL